LEVDRPDEVVHQVVAAMSPTPLPTLTSESATGELLAVAGLVLVAIVALAVLS
jgi:hypothetical protein